MITTNIFSNSVYIYIYIYHNDGIRNNYGNYGKHILSHYRTIKHLEVFAKRCIDQKQNRMSFWNHEYFSMPQNVLQHTDTLNTE